MIVFATNITERLIYIVSTLLGNEIKITSDAEYANAYDGLVLNYSKENHFNQEIWITPIGLLEQNNIIFLIIDKKAFVLIIQYYLLLINFRQNFLVI